MLLLSPPSEVFLEIHEEIPFFEVLDSCNENVLVLNESGLCNFGAPNENRMCLLAKITIYQEFGK